MKPRAWIVDIDGTLALLGDRSPFNMKMVHADKPNEPVIEVVQGLARTSKIILVSGRDERAREATEAWMERWDVPFDALYMRRDRDFRPDQVVKAEILERDLLPKYDIRGVLDDRQKVVDMWRAHGLTCLQVAPGDF